MTEDRRDLTPGLYDLFRVRDEESPHEIHSAEDGGSSLAESFLTLAPEVYKTDRISLPELAMAVRGSSEYLALVLSIMDDNDFSMLWDSVQFRNRANPETDPHFPTSPGTAQEWGVDIFPPEDQK